MSINDTIYSLLDQASAQGQPIPSLRQLRAQAGGGSLTTISEAVKAWRLARLEESGQMPTADEQLKLELGQLLWTVLQPELQKRIERIQAEADKKVAIEIAEASKLREAAAELYEEAKALNRQADDKLAETESVKKDNASLQEKLERLEQDNQDLKELLKASRELEAQRQADLMKAKEAAAAAEASAATIRKLVPFLDPKFIQKR